MADIAMLVAEEYERRVKILRKHGEEIDLMSCVGFLGNDLKGSCSQMKQRILIEEEKLVKGVIDPKYHMSLAASKGVFSA